MKLTLKGDCSKMNNQEIISAYEKGASLNSLSLQTGLSTYKIKKLLQDNQIKIRTRFEQTVFTNMARGKKINHNYFDELNNENVYYLGFLAADGCVRPDRNEIKIGAIEALLTPSSTISGSPFLKAAAMS